MKNLPESKLIKSQKQVTPWKEYKEQGTTYRISVNLRYDDQCGNGHNTFAITCEGQEKARNGRWVDSFFGCSHEKITKYFPKLKPLIALHGCTSMGPSYYIANTLYHASNRDYNGLLKGEKRQIINGSSSLPCWELKNTGEELPRHAEGLTKPEGRIILEYVPLYKIGEGKEREFDNARETAIWPEATDEQLSLPKEELTKLLQERLPALMIEFKAAMESQGFVY
jgi:hypothetical protein